jgi:hypothetical protein
MRVTFPTAVTVSALFTFTLYGTSFSLPQQLCPPWLPSLIVVAPTRYDAAHLSYAWHLDATLMMDQPAIFAEELARVEDALATSMQHPCFLHTGIEDDAGQLGMVVSQFLQRHHKWDPPLRRSRRTHTHTHAHTHTHTHTQRSAA